MKINLIVVLAIFFNISSFVLADEKYECMLHSQSSWMEDRSILTSKGSFDLVVSQAQGSKNSINIAIRNFQAAIKSTKKDLVKVHPIYNKSMVESIESIQVHVKRTSSGSIESVLLKFKGKSYAYKNFALYNLTNEKQSKIPASVRNLAKILDYIVWDLPADPKIGQIILLPYHQQKHGEFSSERLATRYYGMAVRVGDYSDIQYLATSSSNLAGSRVLNAKLLLGRNQKNLLISSQQWETWGTFPIFNSGENKHVFSVNSSHSIFTMHLSKGFQGSKKMRN